MHAKISHYYAKYDIIRVLPLRRLVNKAAEQTKADQHRRHRKEKSERIIMTWQSLQPQKGKMYAAYTSIWRSFVSPLHAPISR